MLRPDIEREMFERHRPRVTDRTAGDVGPEIGDLFQMRRPVLNRPIEHRPNYLVLPHIRIKSSQQQRQAITPADAFIQGPTACEGFLPGVLLGFHLRELSTSAQDATARTAPPAAAKQILPDRRLTNRAGKRSLRPPTPWQGSSGVEQRTHKPLVAGS